jgi:hypothetical protein
MADKYTIELTEEQYNALNERARQHGYADVTAYLLALADEADTSGEPTKEELLAGFQEAWNDAMTGNTHPASILWNDDFWDRPDDE